MTCLTELTKLPLKIGCRYQSGIILDCCLLFQTPHLSAWMYRLGGCRADLVQNFACWILEADSLLWFKLPENYLVIIVPQHLVFKNSVPGICEDYLDLEKIPTSLIAALGRSCQAMAFCDCQRARAALAVGTGPSGPGPAPAPLDSSISPISFARLGWPGCSNEDFA